MQHEPTAGPSSRPGLSEIESFPFDTTDLKAITRLYAGIPCSFHDDITFVLALNIDRDRKLDFWLPFFSRDETHPRIQGSWQVSNPWYTRVCLPTVVLRLCGRCRQAAMQYTALTREVLGTFHGGHVVLNFLTTGVLGREARLDGHRVVRNGCVGIEST
jgi:hypothetical protein